MKHKHRLTVCCLVFITCFLFLSCDPTPPPPESTPEPTPEPSPEPTPLLLLPPENVQVIQGEESLSVSWDQAADAQHYEVFRRINSGRYKKVSEELISETSWCDTDFPYERDIRYKVKSEKDGSYSELSKASNIINVKSSSICIQDVRATVFSNNKGIEITWIGSDEASGYRVYRYRDTDCLPEQEWDIVSPPFFDDKAGSGGPADAIPYFYLVTWKNAQGEEMGQDNDPVPGITGLTVDYHEPNNSLSVIQEQEADIFSSLQPPYIYYAVNCRNDTVADTDWYKYEINETDLVSDYITVTITLPAESDFLKDPDRVLCFRFHYNGITGDEHIINTSPESLMFDIPGSPEPGSVITLYFTLYPDVSGIDESLVSSYEIQVSNEL